MVTAAALLVAALLAPPDARLACRRRWPAPGCARFVAHFETAGHRHGIPPLLLQAVAWRESGCNPCARSSAGAEGMMQLLPTTFAAVSVFVSVDDAFDPRHSIDAGAFYLAALLAWFNGDVIHALGAYNTGPRRVERGVMPTATRQYVADILLHFQSLGGSFP